MIKTITLPVRDQEFRSIICAIDGSALSDKVYYTLKNGVVYNHNGPVNFEVVLPEPHEVVACSMLLNKLDKGNHAILVGERIYELSVYGYDGRVAIGVDTEVSYSTLLGGSIINKAEFVAMYSELDYAQMVTGCDYPYRIVIDRYDCGCNCGDEDYTDLTTGKQVRYLTDKAGEYYEHLGTHTEYISKEWYGRKFGNS